MLQLELVNSSLVDPNFLHVATQTCHVAAWMLKPKILLKPIYCYFFFFLDFKRTKFGAFGGFSCHGENGS